MVVVIVRQRGNNEGGGGGGAPSGSCDPHVAAQKLRVDAWMPLRQRSASYEDAAQSPLASTGSRFYAAVPAAVLDTHDKPLAGDHTYEYIDPAAGAVERGLPASTPQYAVPGDDDGIYTAPDASKPAHRDGGSGPGSLIISRCDGEPWGMGVKPDPIRGVVVTKIKPGGVGARHNLEIGSTFTKIDGTDGLRIDKAKLLHMFKTKTTITVELGPMIQNIGPLHCPLLPSRPELDLDV